MSAEAHDPLEAPVTGAYASVPPVADAPGSTGAVIGPYKLLQLIGEGGMGAVWMAEQDHPVRRRVALKLIKAGMDSRQVLARFEAERQALALMDHPNIAKVLDAGTTETGRPYFVMELVKGVPITRFCDENHLTPRQRLELFVPVCQAVQHAHQKGIIHRDLKPSNVLVALYDDRPVPKVIDFGVAKAAGERLTDRTMFTEFGTVVGTLEYMSPEQAKLNQLDIDTRSDIYSLGVLLYELLTGTTPLDRARLRSAAFDEMLRIIREEEPQKPSTRLSGSAELPLIAASRKTEPAKLLKLVRGELDWIVMKALEKDRGRRYETANGFARDIQRYLSDEAVEAYPPSAAYRLRKFVRKHRAAISTAALFAFVLVLFAALSIFFAIVCLDAEFKAKGDRDRAVLAEQAALAAVRAEADQRQLAETNERKAVAAAAAAKAAQEKAEASERAAVAWITFAGSKAAGTAAVGRYALKLDEEALAVQTAKLGPDHPDTLRSMWRLAQDLVTFDRGAEAIPIIDDCIRRAAGRVVDPRMIPTLISLRLRHFQKTRNAAGCRQTAEMWEQLNRTDADSLYKSACMRAVTARLIKQSPAADAARLADAEADRAMSGLKQAVAAGYRDAAHLLTDPDLAAIRGRADFADLLWNLADAPAAAK